MDARLCLSVSLLTLTMTFIGIFAQSWELKFKASYETSGTTCYEHYTYSPACDLIDGPTPLSFGLVPAIYACAARCQLMKGCRAFLFANEISGGKGACRTYNETLTPLTSCSDYTYGQLVVANCRPGWSLACANDTECSGDRRVCVDGHCTCQAGYMFEPDSGNCVEVCQEYSDEFSVADSTYFVTPITIEITANNKNKCKTECLNHNCRSFQFRPQDDLCVLSNATVATSPGAQMGHDPASFLYQRECVLILNL